MVKVEQKIFGNLAKHNRKKNPPKDNEDYKNEEN